VGLFFQNGKTKKTTDELPLIALRARVIFPGTFTSLVVGREQSKEALEAALKTDRLVVFVAQKQAKIETPKPVGLYSVGTVGTVRRFWKVEDQYNLTIEGIARVYIREFVQEKPYFLVKIEEIPELAEKSDEIEALVKNITTQMKHFGEIGGSLSLEASISIFSAEDPNRLVDAIASGVPFKTPVKQELLEMIDTRERLLRLSGLLAHEIKVLEIGQKIAQDTQRRVGKTTKEAILREQLRSIKRELGEEEEEEEEVRRFKKRIAAAKMPSEARKKANHELDRLSKMHAYNPEGSYIRAYLEWLCELPWSKVSKNKMSIKRAEKVLDADHYGLEKVKERIVEYLAVHKLVGKMKGPILCFIGPPGTGKTSVGRSIARALGRKFIRMSLGGIRDEAEIRGHRRTYVGALPGRIIQGIKNAGTKNPVFMLDEIDKVGKDFRGDPSAALLETLDPEQNNAFSDHYLEVPFDLSDVMFITTGNILDTIPPALKDRMEIIRFAGYTQDEKFRIGRDFLWPKQVAAHGLKDAQIKITDDGLLTIISKHTREAGVRELERLLAAVCRKVAKEIAEKKVKKVEIAEKNVAKFLGPEKFLPLLAEKKNDIGVAIGLAVTQAGGEILTVEVGLMPGKGVLLLTGQLGDVMKESCQAAMSYVRAHAKDWGVSEDFYKKTDVHVHVPAGAVPKDGPSAGVAIITALVSALSKKRVRKEVGMTGEITLRGKVMEIGGIKEKVLAAHRAGLKTVVLPKNNKKDLVDVPRHAKKALKFVFVKEIHEVLENAILERSREREENPKATGKKAKRE
jgi:ATP-dependent Lon protease